MPSSARAQAALLLRCSQFRAGELIHEAHALAGLPEAFEALEWGLLTPEQSAVVVTQLDKLPVEARLGAWQRLLAQLRSDAAHGQPPTRGIRGYDLFYYDASDLSWEAEDRVTDEPARLSPTSTPNPVLAPQEVYEVKAPRRQ